MTELIDKSAVELGGLLVRKDVSARQLAEAAFERIERVEPSVHAFLTLTRDHALAQADAIDNRRAHGEK